MIRGKALCIRLFFNLLFVKVYVCKSQKEMMMMMMMMVQEQQNNIQQHKTEDIIITDWMILLLLLLLLMMMMQTDHDLLGCWWLRDGWMDRLKLKRCLFATRKQRKRLPPCIS
jgi:uncharacterized ion transporter superfamily protein YfcC